MLLYILKRILYFIPTFFIIALITFFLSSIAPGDPVEDKLNKGKGSEGQIADKMAGEQAYNELNEKLGRNLPSFYFSVTSKAYPDTLYKILRKADRETLTRLVDKYGNWQKADAYFKSLKALEIATISLELYFLFFVFRNFSNCPVRMYLPVFAEPVNFVISILFKRAISLSKIFIVRLSFDAS